jgi:Tol biopolymer transport system component/DNA-binding winged helix-turn-helix (wHTH) protein
MSLDFSSSFHQFEIDVHKTPDHSSYRFDGFRLDAGALMLYAEGTEVSLPPKAVRTLVVLVEKQGLIISKADLIDEVWTDAIVEESNLAQYLYLLRKTLGKMPDGRPYIETLRRRGYRFNGAAEVVEAPTHRPQIQHRPQPVSSPTIAVERQGNVLRLVDRSPDQELEMGAVEAVAASARTAEVPATKRLFRFGVASLAVFTLLIGAYIWLSRPSTPVAQAMSELIVQRLTNGAWPTSAIISRDGNYIAYSEIDGETSKIWLQAVGQSSRVPIVAADDKLYGVRAFTPDGRFIYYVERSKADSAQMGIYRVPTIGGPSVKILDGFAGLLSFSPDGKQIAFVRHYPGRSSLVLANSDGGNEEALLTYDEPGRITGSVAWSSDGKRVAFTEAVNAAVANGGKVRLSTVDMEGHVKALSNEVWDMCHKMEWMLDGQGLVLIGTRENEINTTRRDQVYFVSAADGSSRRLTTEAIRHNPESLGVTNDNGVLAVRSNRAAQIWATDGRGDAATAVQLTQGLYDGRAGLTTLPDGKIAYLTYTSDDMGIWLANGDGSAARQLTTEPRAIEELRGDPLGRYFIFSSPGADSNHLYRINVDGSGLRQLTFGEGHEIDSAVSPDGKWVVFGTTERRGAREMTSLRTLPIDGGESKPLGSNECSRPSFAPNGQYVACVTEDDTRIQVVAFPDGGRVASFPVPAYSTLNFGVIWTKNSDGLVFIRGDKSSSNLWVQPFAGGPPVQMTRFPGGVIYRFAIPPKDERILFARGFPIQDVILLRNIR